MKGEKKVKSTVEIASRVYGYCRVSKDTQDNERQQREILNYAKKNNLGDVTIFQEITSSIKKKPELERLMSGLKVGDTLAVLEISRLTRSGPGATFEITKRIRDLGAILIEVSTGTIIKDDVYGEIYLFAMGLSARTERQKISERTKSALRMRKEKGMILGRPAGKSKLDERRTEIEGYQKLELKKAHIARLLGCSRSTYLAWLDKENKKL